MVLRSNLRLGFYWLYFSFFCKFYEAFTTCYLIAVAFISTLYNYDVNVLYVILSDFLSPFY